VDDALRLAFGTLTALRVPPPRLVGRAVGGRAMVLAPLVGLALGLLAVAAGLLLDALGAAPLPCAVAVVGALALLTRGLHLDGLADTADSLGSGRRGPDALAVMSRSDIGPFGVVTLLLVVLGQVALVAQLWDGGRACLAVAAAVVCSRTALPLLCRRGIPAAKESGLGALVAGSITPAALAAAVALAFALAAVTGAAADGAEGVLRAGAALLLTLVTAAAYGMHCVRRFGGVTGDVLGANVELAFLVALLPLALPFT